MGNVKRVLPKLNDGAEGTGAVDEGEERRARGRRGGSRFATGRKSIRCMPRTSASEIKPQHLMAEIDRLSGGQAIVASDVGQHQMWAAQFIRFNEPRLWINSGGLGSMGFGLPAAIGAQFARPDKLVFAIVGDGGFQMSIPELATIANHALPIKIIVMNNGYLGMVRQWQELFYNNRLSQVELSSFPGCGEAGGRLRFQGPHGGAAVEEMRERARRGGERTGPYLLNVKVIAVSKMSIRWCRPAARSTRWCCGRRSRWKCKRRVMTMQQIISLLMENKPGALMRVTGLFSQRGYNIESLTVARTLDPTLSRMTITVDVEPNIRAQVIKQMNKLINVLQATDVTDGPAVNRELVLVRIRVTTADPHGDFERSRNFRRAGGGFHDGRILCSKPRGDPEKLDEFIDVMRSYGEIEVTRSGIVVVSLENKNCVCRRRCRAVRPEECSNCRS